MSGVRPVHRRAAGTRAPSTAHRPLFTIVAAPPVIISIALANAFLDKVEAELRAVMLLVGARDVRALRRATTVLSPDLERWAALASGGRKK